jgi:hypothetical protein
MPPEEESGSFNLEAALMGGDESTETTDTTQESPAKQPTKTALRDTLARGADENPGTDDENEFPAANAEDKETEAAGDAETESEVEPVAPAETPAPPAAEDIDLFAEAAALQVDLSKYGNDKKAAARGLLHAAKLVGQKNELAEYGKRLLESPREVYEFLAKQYAASQAAAPAEPAKPASSVPEYKEEWLEAFDEKGNLLPGADPAIPAKIKKYQEYVRAEVTALATNPLEKLMPLFSDKIAKIAEEKAAEIVKKASDAQAAKQAEYDYHQYAESLVQAESNWAFVDGDRSKGPTEAGKIFAQYLDIGERPLPNGRPQFNDLTTLVAWAKGQTQLRLIQLQNSNAPAARKTQQGKLTTKANRSSAAEKGWTKGLTLEEALMRHIEA